MSPRHFKGELEDSATGRVFDAVLLAARRVRRSDLSPDFAPKGKSAYCDSGIAGYLDVRAFCLRRCLATMPLDPISTLVELAPHLELQCVKLAGTGEGDRNGDVAFERLRG